MNERELLQRVLDAWEKMPAKLWDPSITCPPIPNDILDWIDGISDVVEEVEKHLVEAKRKFTVHKVEVDLDFDDYLKQMADLVSKNMFN